MGEVCHGAKVLRPYSLTLLLIRSLCPACGSHATSHPPASAAMPAAAAKLPRPQWTHVSGHVYPNEPFYKLSGVLSQQQTSDVIAKGTYTLQNGL